jgi:hypothetical protein
MVENPILLSGTQFRDNQNHNKRHWKAAVNAVVINNGNVSKMRYLANYRFENYKSGLWLVATYGDFFCSCALLGKVA